MKKNLSLLLGVAAMVAVISAAFLFKTAPAFDRALKYKSPVASETGAAVETPRDQALRERAEAQAAADAEKPYEEAEYRAVPRIGSRVAIWIVAQLHLLFAAFVLAVPIFALLIEFIGYRTGDKRYDKLAYEFTKLLSASFSFTATLGAGLTFMLIILYPKFTNYLMSVFSPTFLPYVLLFFAEAGFLYSYYYGWGKFSPRVHLFLGLMLNLVGTALMFIANAWLTFMTTPAGISESGAVLSTWDAVNNYTWMPINIHRIIANVAFGGSIAAAYAAFRFLQAKSDDERAHYDWMGYMGNFVAIMGLLPLPFAGYWLASEIYAFSQTMGLTMMGGAFSWLFFIQAFLIGNLFLFANWYLWLGMERIKGAERFRAFIWPLLVVISLCFAIWATPRSLIATTEEIQAMGGSSHPMLGYLGVMSAKNTAVNILILTTFLSFVLYRRSGKIPTVSWPGWMKGVQTLLTKIAGTVAFWRKEKSSVTLPGAINSLQFLIFVSAASTVIFYGIYGYFVDAKTRIGFSVPQVGSVLLALVLVTALDGILLRKADTTETNWGKIRPISQYLLIGLAVTFTWLMGLMGYLRSGLRQHWHVYGVVRDTSPDAYTPTLGFATQVVSFTVLVFFLLIGFIFWLTSLSEKKKWTAKEVTAPEPASEPAGGGALAPGTAMSASATSASVADSGGVSGSSAAGDGGSSTPTLRT